MHEPKRALEELQPARDQEVFVSLDDMRLVLRVISKGSASCTAVPATCCADRSVSAATMGQRARTGAGEGQGTEERGDVHLCGAREITHCPPKSCMPSRAKTTMKRKRRKSKLMIDFIEFRREMTRFLSEFQYLRRQQQERNTNSCEE